MSIYHVPLFPSLISILKCDDFDQIQNSLISWIYEYQNTDEGVTKSNVGGWQSYDHFYKHPTFIKFYDYIFFNTKKVISETDINTSGFNIANMWININKKDNHNALHDHPESHLSGVFWIKIPKESGVIQFETPRMFQRNRFLHALGDNAKQNFYLDFEWNFEPEEGTIMIFPADLLHRVTPNCSEEDRISIAFNIIL